MCRIWHRVEIGVPGLTREWLASLKVLHIIHSMDPKSGGPSHAIRELVRVQEQMGLEPAVLATNAQSGLEWQDDVSYRESVMSEALCQKVPVQLASSLGRNRPWSRYSWSPAAARILNARLRSRQKPDIIHVHGVFSHITQSAARLAERYGVPYVIRPAGALDCGCLKRGHAVLKRAYITAFLRRILRSAAFVHVTSEQEQEPIRQQFPGVRIEIVPHGTEVLNASAGRFRDNLPAVAHSPFVLCLSRIHPIKRLDLAIRAFASLVDDFATLRLVIAGNDAGALSGLRLLALDHHVDDRCVFTGFVTGSSRAKAYSEARLFLHPSDHENFGLSVVEAMAYGCPVVTTKGVASGVYVDKAGAGRVVGSDVEEIAGAMRELLNQSRAVSGNRGAIFVEQNLTWSTVVRKLSRLYESAIDQRQAC